MSTNGAPELRPLLSPTSSEESNGNNSWTLVVVGFAGLISSCSFWTYYVQWHDMLLLLGIPDTIESLSSDLLRFCAATLGILFASVYSATHGKTRVLAGSLLTQVVGSVLVVSAQSIQWLLLGQTVRYFGIAPVWSTSIGIVGEHFSNGARGKPLGSYVFASMTGAAFAPFLYLLIRDKVSPLLSIPSYDAWRLTEGMLGILSLVSWLLVRRLPPSQVVAFSPRPSSASYGSSPVTLTSTTSPSNGHRSSNGYQSTSAARRATDNQAEAAISQSQARSMSPFSPLSLLKLQNVMPLSFASGSLMYSAISLVWMEASQFGWQNVHLATSSDKMAFRRFLPLGVLGMGTGALISGILIDRLASTRSQNRVSPERCLLLSSLGTLLLPIGLLIVGFTLKFALDMDPYKGYDSMNEEMNEMGKVDVSLLMVGVFLSGFGAYSPVVPCIEYFLGLVPEEKNVQIIAASDALQLLASLPLLMVYMIFAQGLGTAVANVIAAIAALYALGSLWRVSARSSGQPAHESGLRDE